MLRKAEAPSEQAQLVPAKIIRRMNRDDRISPYALELDNSQMYILSLNLSAPATNRAEAFLIHKTDCLN